MLGMKLGRVSLVMAIVALGSVGVSSGAAFVPTVGSPSLCLRAAERKTCSILVGGSTRAVAYGRGTAAPRQHERGGLLVARAFGGSAEGKGTTEGGLMSTMRQYGLAAVTVHFTVWATCMAAGVTALTSGVDINKVIEILPASMKEHMDPSGAQNIIAFQISLAVNEIIGRPPLAQSWLGSMREFRAELKPSRAPLEHQQAGEAGFGWICLRY